MRAPGQQGAPASPTQMIAQNNQLRAMLLASAPRMRKNLGSFSGGTPGSTTRVKLFNVGVTTRLVMDVSVSIDIGTATATLSEKAPFNLINRVKLTDYDGTDRVNCSGYQLFVLNCIRTGKYYGYNNDGATAVLANPDIPLLTAGTRVFKFQIEIPLAFDPARDLRGSLLTQTAVGEAWVNIDWNPTLVSDGQDDAFFNGAATTTAALTAGTTITATVYQEYLLPQAVGNTVPLPPLDLMTVYEIAGALRSSDNIANGSEKLFNYPNVRSVIGAYFVFTNNGLLTAATADIGAFRLIANGNNVLREYGPRDKLFEQRLLLNSDIRKGTYFELHRDKPIETALFGNVQYGITPNAAVTDPNFEVCFESFYTKGSVLPGMNQAS